MSASADIRAIQESLAALTQVVGTLVETPAKEKSARGTSRGATRKPKAPVGITHEQAWEALGADPSMPHYADKPATNRQLWVLNDRGMLSLKA